MKLFVLIFLSWMYMQSAVSHAKTLQQELDERAKASAARSPAEVKKVMKKAIDDLNKSGIIEKALKENDKMPAFELMDVSKGKVSSKKLLAKGNLVVTFYRGGWCPYCNIQLHYLQKSLKKIRSLGAELVAISPQKPDESISTAEKQKLKFFVLSDIGSKVSRKFGLMYELPADLIKVYKKFGINLPKSNNSNKWELPISATYVVAKDGTVKYAFVKADYKKRADISKIIDVLTKIK